MNSQWLVHPSALSGGFFHSRLEESGDWSHVADQVHEGQGNRDYSFPTFLHDQQDNVGERQNLSVARSFSYSDTSAVCLDETSGKSNKFYQEF